MEHPQQVRARDERRGVAVVTGGSGGVGRAIVRELAAAGYDVAVLARGQAGLDAAVADVEARGRRGLGIRTDVAEWEQVEAAAERTERELGPIDVWVNNAMTTIFAGLPDVNPHELRRATEVTYLGQVHGAMAALQRMRPRDRGALISVGSALAFRGIPLQAAYCGAKFATRGFMESVRSELISEGSRITVSQVHLPAVNTPQFQWCRTKAERRPRPVAPIYQPELAAQAVVAAVHDGHRQRTVGTWNWLLIRLSQLMPGVADHFMARTGADSQLDEELITGERPDNLFAPVDDHMDHGAHGRFGHESRGVLDPSFVRTLPQTLVSAVLAGVARVREVAGQRSQAGEQRHEQERVTAG